MKITASRAVFACLLLASSFAFVKPAAAGPCRQDQEAPGIYVPDQSCIAVGVGYEFQHFGALGTSFIPTTTTRASRYTYSMR